MMQPIHAQFLTFAPDREETRFTAAWRRWGLVLALSAATLSPALAGTGSGALWDFPQPHPVGELNVTTQVVLRFVTGIYAAPPPPAVITIPVGGTLKLSTPLTDPEIAGITWYKDGEPLSATEKTLVLLHASATDAGLYTAVVQRADYTPRPGTPVLFSSLVERINLHVGDVAPRKLVALSSRTTIDASNPSLIAGFAIDHANASNATFLLIRGVGPSLAPYGIARPLPAPKVALFDARGNPIEWPEMYVPEWDPYALAHQVAPLVGAFPLEPGAKDFAILYPLPSGTYTAHLSSGDGAPGEGLLEIYEVPEEIIAQLPSAIATARPN